MDSKDRLLSEESILKIIGEGGWNRDMIWDIAEAQLAKADKEWVEWLIENLFRVTDYGLEWQSTPRVAIKLAERKLEIGL